MISHARAPLKRTDTLCFAKVLWDQLQTHQACANGAQMPLKCVHSSFDMLQTHLYSCRTLCFAIRMDLDPLLAEMLLLPVKMVARPTSHAPLVELVLMKAVPPQTNRMVVSWKSPLDLSRAFMAFYRGQRASKWARGPEIPAARGKWRTSKSSSWSLWVPWRNRHLDPFSRSPWCENQIRWNFVQMSNIKYY